MLQDPPLGGCDVNDVSGGLTCNYIDGAPTTLEASWTAKVLCTTTASGRPLANVSVTTSLWHSGSPVASGKPVTCNNCNLANSIDSRECVGVTCAGSSRVGAIDRLTPPGWQWTRAGTGCTIPGPTVVQCAVTTDPATVLRLISTLEKLARAARWPVHAPPAYLFPADRIRHR